MNSSLNTARKARTWFNGEKSTLQEHVQREKKADLLNYINVALGIKDEYAWDFEKKYKHRWALEIQRQKQQ